GQQRTPIPRPRPRPPCSFIGETRQELADSEEAEVCRVFYRPRRFNARSQRAKKGDFLSEQALTLRAEGTRDACCLRPGTELDRFQAASVSRDGGRALRQCPSRSARPACSLASRRSQRGSPRGPAALPRSRGE